jgi:hypothetical protein
VLLVALVACGGTSAPSRDAGGKQSVGEAGPAQPEGGLTDASLPGVDGSARDGALSEGGPQTDAEVPLLCDPDNYVPDGCEDLGGLTEADANRCDGFDNDCDGVIDEGCACVDGSVQECFTGPPGRVDIGACQRGIQVCDNSGEFGGWGSCQRGIGPREEVCDRLDNDCNGCIDEREDCDVFIDCPGEGDPRIPEGKPFETYVLDASKFYNGNDVASYKWSIAGSPCDELFASIPGSNTSDTNGRLSYTLKGARQKQARVRFTLSGTYLVTLTIKRNSGQVLSCTFAVVVGAAGLRVELCWDKTGPTAGQNFIDLDLHLALKGQTTVWTGGPNAQASSFSATNFDIPNGVNARGLWNHPNTPDPSGCLTGGGLDVVHELRGNCLNPRLDLDNQGDTDPARYLPENINLDNPRAGEVFQVSVNHRSTAAIQTRALVNVYCGGKLRGSYALDPEQTPFSDASVDSELWRVVELAPRVNNAGKTVDCTLTPLHPEGSDQGALVTEDDSSISWSQ